MSQNQNLFTRAGLATLNPKTNTLFKVLARALVLGSLAVLPVQAQYLVSGRVTTTDGIIPYGIGIQAHNIDSGSGSVLVAYTAEDGRFAFSLPVGDYKFYADPSYSFQPPANAFVRYRPEWFEDAFF